MNDLIIDGGLSRTEAERVAKLLDYANVCLDKAYKAEGWRTFPIELYKKFHELEEEYRFRYLQEDWAFWHELEDEVMNLINDLLPEDHVCMLVPDDPGTVIVCPRSELEF